MNEIQELINTITSTQMPLPNITAFKEETICGKLELVP